MPRLLFLVFCTFCLNLSAQFSITGRTVDSTNNKKVKLASVLLLKAKDTTLIQFTRTNDQGQFELKQIQPDSYKILITYPQHTDYLEKLVIEKADLNLGEIDMIPLAQLMESVIIKAQKGRIKLKGDTLIYLADSFKTKSNATVEDLLKKLPGLQVNRKGEITAQGKKVERVLVDGEEFFGEDPTVATKNLDAKSVAEVKVYDAQSDATKQTGDNSSDKVKTLDIRLKEEAKKGYFGRVTVASTQDLKLFEHRLLYSDFKQKRKFSVFGLNANTNNVGMSWSEREDFGGGNDMTYSNGVFSSSSNDDDMGNSSTNGFPRSNDFGMLYNNQWSKHKLNVNVSYKKLDVKNNVVSKRIQLLQNRELWNQSNSHDSSSKNQWRLSAKWEYQLDSQTQIILTTRNAISRTNNGSIYDALSSFNNIDTLNRQFKIALDSGWNYSSNTSLKISHGFLKKGRKLNFEGSLIASNKSNSNGQNSLNYLRNSLNVFDTLNYNQLRLNAGKSQNVSGKLNFIEPLTKKWDLLIGFDYNQNKQWSLLNVFNPESTVSKIDSLGNDYMLGQSSIKGSLGLQWHTKLWNITANLSPQYSTILQSENLKGLNINRTYPALLPNVNVSWNYSKMGHLSFGYNAQVSLPSATQLQPIINNSNPLFVNKGNINLSQGISHNYNLNFNGGNLIKQLWYMAGGYYNYYASNFITSTAIDSLGKTISTTEMGKGNSNYNFWGFLNKGIPGTPINLSLRGSYSGSSTQVIQNSVLGKNANQTFDLNPSAYIELGDIFMVDLEYNWIRNNNVSDFQRGFSNVNYIQSLTFGFDIGPINKTTFNSKITTKDESNGWSISLDYEANFRQQTAIYSVPNNKLLNGSLSYTYKKEREIIFSLNVNDLLNQNINYSRFVTGNQIFETTNSAFKRYFLFKMTYKFKNKNKSTQINSNTNSNEIEIK